MSRAEKKASKQAKPEPLDDEQDQEPGNDGSERRLTQLLLGFVWQLRGRCLWMLALNGARAACLTATIYFIHRALTNLLPSDGEPQLSAFVLAAVGMLVFQMLAAVSEYLSDEAQRWFGEGVELATFEWVMRHLILLPADYFRDRPLSKFVIYLQRMQTTGRYFLTSASTIVTRGLAIIGIVVGVLPRAPLFAGLGVVLLAVITTWFLRRTIRLRRLAKQELEQETRFNDQALAMLANVSDIHNYGLREQALGQFSEACRFLAARSLKMTRIRAGGGVWLNVAGILLLGGMVAVALGTGISQADVLTSFAAMGLLLEPLSDVVRARATMQTRLTKVRELFHLIDQVTAHRQTTGKQPLGPLESVRFEEAAYHIDDVPVLEGISFEVRRGEILGIIGRSGAGKTTLANLLLRLLDPTAGRILLNGQDARAIDLATYWQQAAYVAQIPCRIGGTLAEEVSLVRPAAAEDEVRRALLEAGIDPALSRQPLDHEDLNDQSGRSAWHSRSLQQRTEWARVLLRGCQLLVLDEPTSFADAVQEQRFARALAERRNERLTVLISHRPTTLAACDRLLVLEAGRIVAQGSRAEILSQWLPGLELEGERAS